MSRPRKLKASYDANVVILYQLCTAKEAKQALRDNSLAHVSDQKYTWIQPSFIWSTVRSGFGRKMQVIQVDVSKEGFIWMLENSCLSAFESFSAHPTKQEWEDRRKHSLVTALWEPDLDFTGRALESDYLRVCLTGEARAQYVQRWVVGLRDVSKRMHKIWDILGHGWDYRDEDLPKEEEYPLSNNHTRLILGLSSS